MLASSWILFFRGTVNGFRFNIFLIKWMICFGHIFESRSSLVSRSCELFLIVCSRSNNYNLNIRPINSISCSMWGWFQIRCWLKMWTPLRSHASWRWGVGGGYGTILFFFFRVRGKELLGCGIVLFPWDKGCGTIVMFKFHHTFYPIYFLSTIPHFV